MNKAEARKRARKIVEQMTVEEMTTQLLYHSAPIERLGIPAYNWWNEALHGVARAGMATVFPQSIGLAAAFDKEMMHDVGAVIAEEGRAKYNAWSKNEDRDIYKGLAFWSPNVNIFRDPRWGRGQETYGEDPYLTSQLGLQFVNAIQEKDENGYYKVAACAKHYAVHSGPESVRHEFDAVVSKQDLYETYLPAFECLAKAGVLGFMGAYNRVYGYPAAGSKLLIQDILRGDWGWDGYFTSDCWAINDFHLHHHVTDTAAESAAMALNTGCDLNCGNAYLHLMTAYNDGLITRETLAQSVTRLLAIRIELGLFDGTPWDKIPFEVVDCEKHREVNLSAAEKTMVLLKNNGILPLDPAKIKTIAVVGPNADSILALEGNYNGKAAEYVTILEGIREAFPDARIYVSEGCHLYREKVEHLAQADDRLVEAKVMAELADVTFVVVGLNCFLEGEEGDASNVFAGGDKLSLLLPESQRKLIDTVLAVGKPTVVACMTGSAMDLDTANEKADAIIQCWYPGALGGRAFGRLVTGKANFSAKLPVTFYRESNKLPDFTDYSMDNRTYKFFREDPLYPFGYGLSYAKFTFSGLTLDRDSVKAGETIKATVTVKNVSDRAGDEVAEFYIRDLEASTRVPRHKLCAFERVSLGAGESTTVTVDITPDAMALIDEDGCKVIEPGKFMLSAGATQPDAFSEKLAGAACQRVEFSVEA